jgi:hypothetical protein
MQTQAPAPSWRSLSQAQLEDSYAVSIATGIPLRGENSVSCAMAAIFCQCSGVGPAGDRPEFSY